MDDPTFLAILLTLSISQAIAANPQLAPMGPQLREMMSSPFFRQMMSNPEMVRSIMQMRGAGGMPGMPSLPGMGAAAGGGGGFPAPGSYDGQNSDPNTGTTGANAPANPFASLLGGMGGPPSGAGGANPFGMDPAMMQSLLGGMGGGAGFGGMGGAGLGGFGSPAAPVAPQDTRPLEERYQSQLLQLNEMGLCDPGQNIRALSMTGGNVNAAIELIFSGRESLRW
jgi:ubiquilin